MSQPHDFPFDITDVAELLHLRIRRPSPQGFYVDCPICNDKRGKMHINTQTDTWRCNYCDESGGMLALYAKVHSISTSAAYREISDALLNGVNLSDHAVKYPDKPKETPAEAAPVADIAVRHKTYTALLAMLTLSKEHRAHLQTVRGLPDEQIERLGYKSMPPFYMCRSLANRLLQNGRAGILSKRRSVDDCKLHLYRRHYDPSTDKARSYQRLSDPFGCAAEE